MPNKLCVYTCITGNYDNLHEIKHPEKNIDYYCFTNNKNLKSKTWKIIQIQNDNLDNHLLSRKIKMLGHPIISQNYNISVWMDASVIWDQKINDFVKTYLKNYSFSAFKHHERKSIYDEAIACLELRKDTKENILHTLDYLQSKNFPDNLGLYEMTVFIKKHNDPTVIKTMQLWFDTISAYSKRDQLSFMYAIWVTKLKISRINLNVWNNQWFHNTKHIPNSSIDNCHVYYGNLNQDFKFNKYFIYDYQRDAETYSFHTTIPNNTNIIEFSPSTVIGTNCQNITIKPAPSHLTTIGTTTLHQNTILCTNHSLIQACGHFQKNQKLFFSIRMDIPDQKDLNEIIEKQWAENTQLSSKNAQLKIESNQLNIINSQLQNDISQILNSHSWKTIQKFSKISQIFKPKK